MVGGRSSKGVSDQASVTGSRCASSTAAKLSPGLTPSVVSTVYGPMAMKRSANLFSSANSRGSLVSIGPSCLASAS